ncbi:MAG: DUF4240 domain-containing protein [Chryseolinea sp.]
MGLFDKLFGGKNGDGNKPPESTAVSLDKLMDEEQFWEIIKRSKDKSDGNIEQQQLKLAEELNKLAASEIVHFDNRFRYFRGEANTWELWGAIYIIHGGCGDDSFNDFREWVIGQGRDFYCRTTQNPETLIDVEVGEDWEGLGYVAESVFKIVTEHEMPRTYQENFETTGEQWEEDGDDLERMYPKLYAKYNS